MTTTAAPEGWFAQTQVDDAEDFVRLVVLFVALLASLFVYVDVVKVLVGQRQKIRLIKDFC